jgi:hypothetical protein
LGVENFVLRTLALSSESSPVFLNFISGTLNCRYLYEMLKRVQHDVRQSKAIVLLNLFQDLSLGGICEMLKQVQHDVRHSKAVVFLNLFQELSLAGIMRDAETSSA